MINDYLGVLGGQGSFLGGAAGTAMLLLIIAWSLAWKGLALWRAGREDSKWWFIAILIINTLGILEIVYLLFFTKKARESRAARKTEAHPQ